MVQPVTIPSEKPLPHNLEAERCVLGAILIHNEAFNVAAELVDQDDFFREAHRLVFERMIDLNERQQAIDFVTLKDELNRSGDLDKVGGPAYISTLADGVPRSTNVEHYARIVKEKAALRKLIYTANKIVASAYSAEDEADAVIDRAEQQIFSIAEDKIHTGFVPLSDLVQDGFARIEKLQENKSVVTGVPTGFADIDEMTSGLQPQDLVIIAARPSMGKTAFALNIAHHVGTKTDRNVGVFSLEMSKEQLFIRLLTSEAQIDASRFRTGMLSEADYLKLSEAMGKLSEANVFIDDSPGLGVLEMRAKSRRLKAERGLDLVIIDYLQLMTGRGRYENRTLELASISRALKNLAKEIDVPVVALSQLSRAPEARSDHRPQLSDLRESGALEQDADVVMFIFREDMYEETPDNQNTAEIIVGKQRNGPTGVVKLAFLKQQTRFESLAPKDYQ